MGVQGLKTYIESSSRNDLKTWAFRDKQLIIDGCNLFYSLCFDSNLDQIHGGDYDTFEKVVRQFFENLSACDVHPYVVIDGGDDHTDKKWDTLLTRKQKKIKDAYDLSLGKRRQVLPLLTEKVFKQVLKKLKVPVVQTLEEADWEIAALAEEWNCPVLSNDSDIYIFNLRAGLLPITHFHWRKVRVNRKTNQKFILSKHFIARKFCKSFKMNVSLLPVFASILGNDYVKLPNIKNRHWERYSNPGSENPQIEGLLNWLSQFSGPDEAISALLRPTSNKTKAQEELSHGIQDYKLVPGSLAQIFCSTKVPQKISKGPLHVLPRWTLRPILDGKMSSYIINVLLHNRASLNAQVEDFQLPSANETSLHIRQVFYGLLLLGEQQTAGKRESVTGTTKRYVVEYSRQQIKRSSENVEAIQTKAMEGLRLETLYQEPHAVRLQVILDTLGVSCEMLKGTPDALQLQMFVTRYWLVNAEPQPCRVHLWGLLLGMVYGKLSSSPNAQKDMLSRLRVKASRKGGSVDIDVAHAYSQWQSCLKFSLNLNYLLSFPLTEPDCASLYRGSLVHQAVGELRRGISLEALLVKGSSAERIFKQLKDIIVSLMGDDFIKKMKSGLEHRDAGKTQRASKGQKDELDVYFEQMMIESIDSEDEELLDVRKSKAKNHLMELPVCPIRARHKAKARNARHPCKKYERRCFE